MTDPVIFSRNDVEVFTPPGSPRSYQLAPLTYRERQMLRADMVRAGLHYPQRFELFTALRLFLKSITPTNLAELLHDVDQADLAPDDPEVQARLAPIEREARRDPGYAGLLAQQAEYIGLLPFYALRHALRGWDGPGLPDFRRVNGLVPDDLLEALPQAELEAAGWRANALATLGAATEKNSVAGSPPPATLKAIPAGSGRSAAATGRSATKSGRRTRG